MTGYNTIPTVNLFEKTCPHARREATIAAQEAGPLARVVDGWPVVQVLRQHDVSGLLRDPRLNVMGARVLMAMGITHGPLVEAIDADMSSHDGEQHSRLRRLLAAAFTPRSVEQLRPFARARFAGLLDAVYEQGGCDAATDLCDPYTTPVICELIGFPPDRWPDIRVWSQDYFRSFGGNPEHREAGEHAVTELRHLVDTVVAERRLRPCDDLISRLVELEQSSDRLTQTELREQVVGLLVAGTDTTRNQLSLIIELLARHPDVWAELRADPSLVGPTVEEAMRFVPTVTAAFGRVAASEIEIGGEVIPAGTMLFLNTLGANIDNDTLTDARRFDIHRELPKGWHLHTFGGGPHYCLGASLARLELVEALSELVARCPVLELTGEPTPLADGSPLVGYGSLPIRWR